MAKDPTQKAKLTLKAIDLAFTQDITDDCYLQPKLQKCLNMHDLAGEVAALSTRQEDVEEITRTGNQIMRRMIWYLSSGYSISTVLGYFRPTSQGVFLESELMSAPDRKRLKLGVAYSMSQEMRQALADAEIDVETLSQYGHASRLRVALHSRRWFCLERYALHTAWQQRHCLG